MHAASTPDDGTRTGKSPVIGVAPCLDAGQLIRPGVEYLYLNRGYCKTLHEAGATPLVLPLETAVSECLRLCDGLLLSGGGDLPHRFDAGASADVTPGPVEDDRRVRRERQLLEAFAEAGRPVLGVCFGMQLMNLHFGGSLCTNLARRDAWTLDHGSQRRCAPHPIRVSSDSVFFSDWTPPASVSSSHGQAVENVAPGFRAVAWSSDGVIEAMERGSLLGVEWHPESDESGPAVYGRWLTRSFGA